MSDPGTAAPAANPDYNGFLQNLISGTVASNGGWRSDPNNVLSSLTGSWKDNAVARAKALAPAAWQQFQQAQLALQNSGLDTMQRFAMPSANTGVPIPPSDPMSALPAYTAAMRTQLGGLGMGPTQPAPGAAAPAPGSVATGAAPENAITHMDGLFGGQPVNPAIVARYESSNNLNAVSPKGATGTMQVMPATAADPGFGVAPAADSSNGATAQTGANYLAAMQARYKSPTLGLIAYNWGPGNTDKWLASGADPTQLPQETRDYVGNIVHAQTGGVMPQAGQAQPAPGVAPQQPAADPTAPLRALYGRFAAMNGIGGNTQAAKTFFDMQNAGRPDGAVVAPDGRFTEPTIDTPTGSMPAQQYSAQGAGMTSTAQEQAKNAQTPVQVVTRTGPKTISQADLLNTPQMGADGKPNMLPAESSQYKAIQAQQTNDKKALEDNAVASGATANTAVQLYNAAAALKPGDTGAAGNLLATWRKNIIAGMQAAGVTDANGNPLNSHIADTQSAFEQMNFQGLNFVQASAHGFSPRAALQIVKMIQSVKPGAQTTPQGLRDIITKQVLPGTLRDQAMYKQANDYYAQNPLANDAMTVLPSKNPIGSFGVKGVNSAQPGDYFVDPRNGMLRQRPVQ